MPVGRVCLPIRAVSHGTGECLPGRCAVRVVRGVGGVKRPDQSLPAASERDRRPKPTRALLPPLPKGASGENGQRSVLFNEANFLSLVVKLRAIYNLIQVTVLLKSAGKGRKGIGLDSSEK